MTLVFFSFVTINLAKAQNNYEDGFILLSGDTLKGKVKVRSSSKNFHECLFLSPEGASKSYAPDEIKGFGYTNGKYYLSGLVNNEFLEVIVQGHLKLLLGSEGFYLQEGNDLTYLDNPKNSESTSGKNRWKGVLSYMVSSCNSSALSESIEAARYNERSISEIIVEYHKCSNQSYLIPKGQDPWVKVYKGIVVEYASTSINTNRTAIGFPLIYGEEYNSNDFVFGISLDWTSPRSLSKTSFYTELLFVPSQYSEAVLLPSITNTDFGDPDFRGRLFTTEFNLSHLSLPLGLKYAIPSRSSQLSFTGGLHLNVYFSPEINIFEQEVNGGTISDEGIKSIGELRSGTYGIWGGFGYSREFGSLRATLAARYFHVKRLNIEDGIELGYNRLSFGLTLSK